MADGVVRQLTGADNYNFLEVQKQDIFSEQRNYKDLKILDFQWRPNILLKTLKIIKLFFIFQVQSI